MFQQCVEAVMPLFVNCVEQWVTMLGTVIKHNLNDFLTVKEKIISDNQRFNNNNSNNSTFSRNRNNFRSQQNGNRQSFRRPNGNGTNGSLNSQENVHAVPFSETSNDNETNETDWQIFSTNAVQMEDEPEYISIQNCSLNETKVKILDIWDTEEKFLLRNLFQETQTIKSYMPKCVHKIKLLTTRCAALSEIFLRITPV